MTLPAPSELSHPDMSRQVSEALLETASDAILATDCDGTIRLWNPGAARIFGFSPVAAIGKSLDIIIPENLRARHWQGWNHALAAGKSRYGAGELLGVPALTADGRRISVEFTIMFTHTVAGDIDGVVAILRDVTARFAETRDLQRKLAALAR